MSNAPSTIASSDDSITMVTMSAPTNIAVIKYWGKACAVYNTPINSSASVTLDQDDLRAVTTVAASSKFTHDRLWLNGIEDPSVAANQNARFRACLEGVRAMAARDETSHTRGSIISHHHHHHHHIHVSSYNTFPTAAGLASSAAGYAALVACLAKLMDVKEAFPGELSTIARQGSGSACRSLYGGFVAWRMGSEDGVVSDDSSSTTTTTSTTASPPNKKWQTSKAEQIADETFWPEIRALIMVVSDAKKDTSSTAGMSTSVATSSLLTHRARSVVPERMVQMEQAWLAKDFGAFGKLTMQDSNQFHATCLDTYPPIFYMNDVSRCIVRLVTLYNAWSGEIRAAYTFDAGPNAVLYVLDQHCVEVGAIMVRFFPGHASSKDAGSGYINKQDFAKEVASFVLDPELLQILDKTGITPTVGDVKMIYLTKAGPGPKVLDAKEHNLDPVTGQNTYVPP